MGTLEFAIPTRLDHLFSASSKQYSVQVLSKQSVTVEVLQLKRSMYSDAESFIFNNFDVYCNLIRLFAEFDESLKITAFRVLMQVSEKMMNSLASTLDNSVETELSSRYRNMVKMSVYILCQLALAFEQESAKKSAAANIGKGRKKKVSVEDSECNEWPDERVKFSVLMKKIFNLPIQDLWNPPIIEYEFINFVTTSFFKLLEHVEVSKDKVMKKEIFRFLGAVLKKKTTGLGYSIKILQMVQDFEHLSTVMAEAVEYFVLECSADTMISDICREATLLDGKNLVQNITAAHSVCKFLTTICEKCPEKVSCVVGSLLQLLEMESHVMRNCILSIIGVLIIKLFCNENLSAKDQKTREELLEHLMAHLLDVNSFVRSKAIQVLKNLMDEKALSSAELHYVGEQVSDRLRDKASLVRKIAISFMTLFVDVNEFACKIPLEVLRGSYDVEHEKLKTMQKSRPMVFEDSEDDEPANDKAEENGLIFDDSDDEDEGKKDEEKDKKEAEEGKDESPEEERIAPPEEDPKEGSSETSDEEAFEKQKTFVSYLKNTLNFAEVIHGLVEPMTQLLRSSTQTDVLEAIEFFTAAAGNVAMGLDAGIRLFMNLVWSNEAALRDAALNAFKALYLYNPQEQSPKGGAVIAKNLIDLLKEAKSDDVVNLQAIVRHFCKTGEIPETLSNVLWANFKNPASGVTEEEKISILIILSMVAEEQPTFVLDHMNEIVSLGLESEGRNNYLIAKHIFQILCMSNAKNRGKYNSVSDIELRLPANQVLAYCIKSLLIDGIQNFEDDQWSPMASEAVHTIFCLIDEPIALCTEVAQRLSEIANTTSTPSEKKEDVVCISSILVARFMSFCGGVALHYMTYLRVDYFAHLRREELQREQRRKSTASSSVFCSTPAKTPRHPKTPKSKSKARKSIHKSYKLVPPINEEATHEKVIQLAAKEVQNDETLIGSMLPAVVGVCYCSLKEFNKEVQAAASVALAKFMLISEKVCEQNMQLFATITEKSEEAYVRANMLVAMGDLTKSYPNVVEPWTPQIYQRLGDADASVREAAIVTLTHLILHDFVRVKSLVSEAAKCIADPESAVSNVAKYLFAELSKKGNVIYNIIPDIISSLSDPKSGFSEENFQTVLRHMLKYVEKEKLVEGLVEKLCYRFTDSSSDIQLHELTFCLSILTLNDKCYSKLMEFKNLLKERMSDPIIMKYITRITANAKKNDARTAAELETFRNELGI